MGRPRLFEEERTAVAVRLPKTLADRLRAEARERQVSVNVLVAKATEDCLERLIPVEDMARPLAEHAGESRAD